MTEAGSSPSKEVLRSLRLLRSPDPEDRKRAIRFLSTMRSDPRVQQVFEHMYKKDPDPSVRQLAWRAMWPSDPSVPAPAPRQEAPPPAPAPVPIPADLAPPPPLARPAARRPARLRRAWRQPFLLNPSNAPLVEQERARRAKRKKTARWTFRLGALLLLLMAVLWGALVPEWVRWFQFERDGVTVAGMVAEREQRGDDRYIVRYRYSVGDEEYAGEQRVTESAYAALADGAAVSVRVLPDDPADARLEADSPEDRFRNYLTAVVAGLTLAALLMLLSAVLRRRRALRIVPPAVLTGQVVACEGALDDDGDFKVKVRFRFLTPRGQTLSGQARQIRNDLRDRPLPPTGAPVAVYYRHEQSYRLL
ncbi:MAG: HEAT repeat domain-containing protein [Chloroflexota bacterium]